jgi:methyltransferase (TIGR00027 family)
VTKPRHSTTAEGVALARAAHQVIDSKPLIFSDPLALKIIGASGEAAMRQNMAMYAIDGMRRARGSIAVRSRFTDEEIERALSAGTRQYVILGAGLDTFAYRRTDLGDRLAVYEVDHPDTQAWKIQRLAEAHIAIPPNVHFVPVDFNERALAKSLDAAGFRRDVPALFSWLGVVYYLPRASVLETLQFIAAHDAASGVILDFAVPESTVAAEHRELLQEFLAYNRSRSERWRTWFTPQEMASMLRACGFSEIVHLDYETIASRYLAGREDALLPSPLVGLISARK